MTRIFPAAVVSIFLACQLGAAEPVTPEATPEPPVTWIDQDTGHRVWRLSSEPNSSGLYFNANSFTPDKKTAIYTAADGLHAIDLANRKTRLVLANDGSVMMGAISVFVGRKTNSIFYYRETPDAADAEKKTYTLWKVDVYSGETKKLADIPKKPSELSINADETIAAGIYRDGPPAPGSNYNPNDYKPHLDANGKPMTGPLVQHDNKYEMMNRRLEAKIPLVLFTVNLKTGKVGACMRTTTWLNHLLFSPSDPNLLMYCHEGHWQKVDRLWFVHPDGTGNRLIHKRQMTAEVVGHEFWAQDGKSIWYDLQFPQGTTYWLAGYEVETGRRTWYHAEFWDRSLHFNVAYGEPLLFCGDGSDPKRAVYPEKEAWIKLFHPELKTTDGITRPEFIQPGILKAERLVNMSKHDYHCEPNVRFTPDNKMILFTGNMFGPSYVYGVEVEKAAPEAAQPQQ